MNNYKYNKYLCKDFVYFTVGEFRCNCKKCDNKGFPVRINAKLLNALETMRKDLNKPIIVTSGLRCKNYNAEVKGNMYSKHLRGMACDVAIEGVNPKVIHDYWKEHKLGYSYYGTTKMGNACHVQIGW